MKKGHYCANCGVLLPTQAERLLHVADMLMVQADRVVCMEGYDFTGHEFMVGDLARVKLALALRRMSNGRLLQAIFEDWDMARIVREVY